MKKIDLVLVFCCFFLQFTDLLGQLEMHGTIRDYDSQQNLINAHIYNLSQSSNIWEELQKLNQIKLTKENLIVKNDIQQRGISFKGNNFLNEKFFENNYTRWSKKDRITIKNKKKKQKQYNKKVIKEGGFINQPQVFLLDQLNLDVKLYFDVISPGKNLIYESSTILDIFNSYNYLNQSKALNCYINIYFDIGEVFRRKLVERIEKSDKSIKSIQNIYDRTIDEMNLKHNTLIKEAFAGRDIDQLERWNRYILKDLGINNFELIGFGQNAEQMKQNIKNN